MKIFQLGIFVLLVTVMVSFCAAEDQEIINELCRFRIATIPHPNPELCHLYVQCQLLIGDVRECPEDYIFVEQELCVPGNRESCQRDNPNITETTAPTTTEIPSVDGICDGINLGFLPDPRTCQAFILCVFETPDFITCPYPTLVFDTAREQCVEGNPETCEIFGQPPPPTLPPPTLPPPTLPPPTLPPTTTPPPTIPPPTLPPPTLPPPTLPPPTLPPPTLPPTTTPPPTIPPPTLPPPTLPPATTPPPTLPPPTFPPPTFPPIVTTTTERTSSPRPPFDLCRGNNFLFVADPSSCYRYFFCVFGAPIPGECDPDRIFNERLRGCVLGDQETCTRNRNIDIEIIRPN